MSDPTQNWPRDESSGIGPGDVPTSEASASPRDRTAPWADLPPTEPEAATTTWADPGLGGGEPPTTLHAPAVPGRVAGPSGPHLPGYEILERLPGGGMGELYRARRLDLNSIVALKVLPKHYASDATRVSRFWNEARIGYGLRDDRILPVKDLRWVDGCPVLVMPFIEGTDLGKMLRDRVMAAGRPGAPPAGAADPAYREHLARVLPLLDQLVEAVASAHEARVLHRDIKPANCLVDEKGHLYLSDFGLARIGESSDLTTPGDFMGTRGYAPPEQWDGLEDIDRRADVFSLGATLYYALTLALPFGRERITRDTPRPVPPSRRRPEVSADFDAVLLKALELDRSDRYEDARALRDDWRLIRSGKPPKARRIGPAGRLARQVGRHPRATASLALVLLLLLGALITLVPRLMAVEPPPGDGRRAVRIGTVEPAARFAFIPRSPYTGEPIPASPLAVRGFGGGSETLEARLAPGDYLVVVQWPDGRFHEVDRRVPAPGESFGHYWHDQFNLTQEGGETLVVLPSVRPPPAGVEAGMVWLDGGEFTMPADPSHSVLPRHAAVEPYWLDATEVTWGQYRSVTEFDGMRTFDPDRPPPDDVAVTDIRQDHARHIAELLGKRLMTEQEYLFPATVAGTRRYPWGDDPSPLQALGASWPVGLVGLAGYDRTATKPPILGLYSNAAEWTSTWPAEGMPHPEAGPDHLYLQRVVRGAPKSVIDNIPEPGEILIGPAVREAAHRSLHFQGSGAKVRLGINLGFRCARSGRPRFLDPPATSGP